MKIFVITRGNMELVKWISLFFIAVTISFNAMAQDERLNFQQRLLLQEKEERKQLEKMIESLSDEDYRSYLNSQLHSTMNATGINSATIIVDVTDMQSSTTALKTSSEISPGAIKLKLLMAQKSSVKNNRPDIPNAHMTVVSKQWAFSK